MELQRVLVTGGAGFIGSTLIRWLLDNTPHVVVNVDKLTYAGNRDSLREVEGHPRYLLEVADVADQPAVDAIFRRHAPIGIYHLAAESHVDRSIDGPSDFVHTNVVGTFVLLQCALAFWRTLSREEQDRFRFLHVSTDEVYGALGDEGAFTERTAYAPNSPYAATKAGADHLVRAWFHTYGLPVVTTNCSNNYGPRQFPEKLIPLAIHRAVSDASIPVYGGGQNVRDWLFVEDHAVALQAVFDRGRTGETYNIGGGSERRNLDVVELLCTLLDELQPRSDGHSYRRQVEFVTDRPGHDFRYAMDFSKLRGELGWAPRETFESGLRRTVQWYLENQAWVERVISGEYRGERLGLGQVRTGQ